MCIELVAQDAALEHAYGALARGAPFREMCKEAEVLRMLYAFRAGLVIDSVNSAQT
jgi:hypothetical protein